MFDQTLLLEMGTLFLSTGRLFKGLILFGLFLGIAWQANYYALQIQNPFYEKIQHNPWIRKADSLFVYKDDYQGAADLLLRVLDKKGTSDDEMEAYCYIKLGNVYTSLENYVKASSYFNIAKNIIVRQDPPNNFLRVQYNLYYGKYLLRLGELDSATSYIERSLRLNRDYFVQDSLGLAEILFFRAELFDEQGRLTNAEDLYRQIENIYNSILPETHFLYGRLFSYLGICLRDQLDYRNAIDYIDRAILIFSQDSTNNLNRLAVVNSYLASIYSAQKKYKPAISIRENLLKLIQNNSQLERFRLYSYSNLISDYIDSHQFEKAKYYLDAYLKFVTSSGSISSLDEAFLFLYSGQYFLEKNDLSNAKINLRKSNNLYEKKVQFDINNHTTCNELFGDLYLKNNSPDSALYYYQQALIVYLDDFNNENIYSNPETQDDPNQREIFDIMYRKARAFRRNFDMTDDISHLKEAFHIYNLIDKLNDEARNSNLRDASLLILNDYYHQEYEKAVDCAYELFNLTNKNEYLDSAFRLMEKSKSMLLFKSLTLAERSRSINLPYSFKKHEDSLRMLNLEYEQKIRVENAKNVPDLDKIQKLKNLKFKTTQDLYDLKYRISQEFPAYYQIRYDSLTKNLQDFQDYCRQNRMTGIEYFWGDQAIYTIGSNGQKTDFIKTVRTENYDLVFHRLLIQLSAGTDAEHLAEDYRHYIRYAYLGYQYLFGELDPSLLQSSRLLIIPDGNLAQLPFEALLTQPGDSGSVDYVHLPYLILDKSVSYSYSFNFLQTTQKPQKKSKNTNSLLAFSYSDVNVLSKEYQRADDEFELFYSSEELKTIRKIMPKNSRFFYGQEATEHQFKKLAPDYELIHLAVHGFADTLEGDNSRLIFKKGEDPEDDSILYMHELYGMDLSNTDLAVLSACESGIGKEFRGEGVFSMARGFFYAGCPSIVMSLWRVSDKHTSQLMGDFYKYLKRGKHASNALRDAKLNFIKKQDKYNAHPVHWASFVYLGEEFQYKKQPMSVFLIFSIVVVSFLLIYIVFKLRRSYS